MDKSFRRKVNHNLRTPRNINKLNKLYYCSSLTKMTGQELRTLVQGRKVTLDQDMDDPDQLNVVVYKRDWKTPGRTWEDMACLLNTMCVQDQLREKVPLSRSDETYVVQVDLPPSFDEDMDLLLM